MAKNQNTNDIIDIDLSVTRKKRFRLDDDNDRIIYLNTSDFTILNRLEEVLPKLQELVQKAVSTNEISDDDSDEVKTGKTLTMLREIDTEMRALVDYTFDSKVADVCAPDGSMYDLFNGEFRFEHIFSVLLALYESNMNTEYKKLNAKMSKHTNKYINKK